MATETPQTLKLPSFRYSGFNVPALELSTSLIDDLGTSEPAYKLAPNSVPLSEKVALYIVGRNLELGINNAESLPEPVREAGRLVYSDSQERKGRGVWHKDGVLFLPRDQTPKGMVQPKDEGYSLGLHFKDIEGFEDTGDGWKIKASQETEETYVWVPEGNGKFVVPTMDGLYNPITGLPFETIEDREKAVKRWTEAGFIEEQADKELSRFYKIDRDIRAVYSWSNVSDGPLVVSVSNVPDFRGSFTGSFAASRSAERSEDPKD